jgi:hypothetical protein
MPNQWYLIEHLWRGLHGLFSRLRHMCFTALALATGKQEPFSWMFSAVLDLAGAVHVRLHRIRSMCTHAFVQG